MTVGPIPWVAVDRFIESRLIRGWIDIDEAADLETLVLALDDHEMNMRDTKKPTPGKEAEK